MAASTLDYALVPSDGWTQVADAPAFLLIGANVCELPFYVALGASAPSANSVNATGTLTFTGLPVANETFTVGGVTYTFKASVTTTANQIKIGADATATAANVAAAVNAGVGSGTVYGSATVANSLVSASSALGVVTFTSLREGTQGNAVTLTEALTNATVSGAVLTGGVNAVRGVPIHGHLRVQEALTTKVFVRVYEEAASSPFHLSVAQN
jgi:hypothetical protein